ncbi:MAG: isoprenyl transferase [Bacteroidaceae bacterium]|jgi:undecaprenyl diphosphate synthase|nr:isoprenyl transferase [Bacteroidaceae bacterium]
MSVQLDLNRIPRHIAIIMDGNGRWAKARGQERTVGHQQGAQQVHEIMEEAVRLGVDYLTLYTFSTENWNRPKEEITALMALLLQHLDEDTFMKNNARFKVIGDVQRLSPIVQDAVAHLAEITKNNTNTCMVVALSYSSKWELTKAMQDIAAEVEQGKLKSTDITEETINQHLETKGMPEPELMIRTGGELRLSNYLLWQCAYSEFYFTDVYWPDFTIDEFRKAIADYQGRQRRYGKTGDQIVEETNK